jgi:glycosyltransferase involved in cell wall biosynthesis
MTDFLFFSSSDWDWPWGSRQQVSQQLAQRGHRVLFVERLAGLEHLWKYPALRANRRLRAQTRLIQPNIWGWTPPVLLPGRYYAPVIAWLNALIVQRLLRPFLQQLNFTTPILWLYQPEQAPLMGRFGETAVVYHCIDEFTVGTTGRKRQVIGQLEKEILRQADCVFANSPPTYEAKRPFNPHTYRIPSGVDAAHFAQAISDDLAVHPAIATLPSPRFGYIGNINERLNYEILTHLAQTNPDASLVLVGDTYPWTMAAPPLRPLQTLPNVYFLGKFPYAEMPALVKGMDVCLLPYVTTEHAYFRSPLKLYEYLAAGKPVVSTPNPEAQELGAAIYLADDRAAFVAAVAQALATNTAQKQQKRLQIAYHHSWHNRVSNMLALIAAVQAARGVQSA